MPFAILTKSSGVNLVSTLSKNDFTFSLIKLDKLPVSASWIGGTGGVGVGGVDSVVGGVGVGAPGRQLGLIGDCSVIMFSFTLETTGATRYSPVPINGLVWSSNDLAKPLSTRHCLYASDLVFLPSSALVFSVKLKVLR